jgi:hypothetical protein
MGAGCKRTNYPVRDVIQERRAANQASVRPEVTPPYVVADDYRIRAVRLSSPAENVSPSASLAPKIRK